MTMRIEYLFYLLAFVMIGCTKTNDKEIESYFRRSGDSLSLQSYLYLQSHLSSEKLEVLTMDKSYLISYIENAVRTSEEHLKTEDIPFLLFCEYLLPPIIEDEPLENWREKCLNKFSFLNTCNIVEVCDTINSWLSKDFSFSYGEMPAQYMSWSQLDTLKKGDCFHMAKSVLYPLRALGYPCTIDFTPCWGNTTGGHSWNVVYINGDMVPFMGRETGVYEYDPFRIYNFEDPEKVNPGRYPGKIYRKTFSVNNVLQQRINHIPMEDLPPFLSDCRIKDVTAEYLPVSDIRVEVTDTISESEPVYLAVYSNEWTATACADRYKDRTASFKNMKNEMLYMPVVYRKGDTYPVDNPFIINRNGEKQILDPKGLTERCVISYLLPLMTEMSTAVANKDNLPKDIFDRLYTGEKRKRPVNGEAYSVFYWKNNKWQYLDTEIAANNHIVFPEVPQNALLHLADKDKKLIGRCFTLDKGEMIWW